jgi:hypothetical protein
MRSLKSIIIYHILVAETFPVSMLNRKPSSIAEFCVLENISISLSFRLQLHVLVVQ